MSKVEDNFIAYLHDNGVERIIHNDRQTIAPLEIDVVCPDYRLGFELNPVATHGSNGLRNVDDYYHMEKALQARESGLRLTHIFGWSMSEKSPVWQSEGFTSYVAGLIMPEHVDVVKFVQLAKDNVDDLWHQWDVFERCQRTLAQDDTIWVGLDDNDDPIVLLWQQLDDQHLASYMNENLDTNMNVHVWRYLGKPGIVMDNFWEVWNKTKQYTLLMESLDCQQIAIPLQELYPIKTMSPDYYVMPVRGQGHRQTLNDYMSHMLPYDANPSLLENMAKHGFTRVATAGYQLWSSFLF